VKRPSSLSSRKQPTSSVSLNPATEMTAEWPQSWCGTVASGSLMGISYFYTGTCWQIIPGEPGLEWKHVPIFVGLGSVVVRTSNQLRETNQRQKHCIYAVYKGMKPSENYRRKMYFVRVLFMIWKNIIYGFRNYYTIQCQCWITSGVFLKIWLS
jgi:hypothetical protein